MQYNTKDLFRVGFPRKSSELKIGVEKIMDYIKWIRSKVGHDQIFLNFVAAYIIDSNEDILLQRRSKDKEEWGFPGGAMEIGESAEEALIREVKEETGLDVKVDEFIGAYTKYFAEYPNAS